MQKRTHKEPGRADEQQISGTRVAVGSRALAAGRANRNTACEIPEVIGVGFFGFFFGGEGRLLRSDETLALIFAPYEGAERPRVGGQGQLR